VDEYVRIAAMVGEDIRRLLDMRGLTIKDLGMCECTAEKYARGQAMPGILTLIHIASKLDAHLEIRLVPNEKVL